MQQRTIDIFNPRRDFTFGELTQLIDLDGQLTSWGIFCKTKFL